MDKKGDEVIPKVSTVLTSKCSVDDVQSTEIGSDSNCYLVNICMKPANHEIRHYLKGKCKILADLGESQEVYGKEEIIPIDTVISPEDMPNPKEVFWTDHGQSPPECLAEPEVCAEPSGISKGNQKPYRLTEIGISKSTLEQIVEESVYWNHDKPIIHGKEFDRLSTFGRQKATE
jgi:hypothetical protein